MSKEELIEALRKETDPVTLRAVEHLLMPSRPTPEPADPEELKRLLDEALKDAEENGPYTSEEIRQYIFGNR